ncbi:hypothetical protein EJB05_52673, partial [Eragrostis curvula]
MDVYISEEYVVQRRAERRVARNAAAAAAARGGREEKADSVGEQKRWMTGAWAEKGKRAGAGDGNANAGAAGGAACRVEDVIFSYFSA